MKTGVSHEDVASRLLLATSFILVLTYRVLGLIELHFPIPYLKLKLLLPYHMYGFHALHGSF